MFFYRFFAHFTSAAPSSQFPMTYGDSSNYNPQPLKKQKMEEVCEREPSAVVAMAPQPTNSKIPSSPQSIQAVDSEPSHLHPEVSAGLKTYFTSFPSNSTAVLMKGETESQPFFSESNDAAPVPHGSEELLLIPAQPASQLPHPTSPRLLTRATSPLFLEVITNSSLNTHAPIGVRTRRNEKVSEARQVLPGEINHEIPPVVARLPETFPASLLNKEGSGRPYHSRNSFNSKAKQSRFFPKPFELPSFTRKPGSFLTPEPESSGATTPVPPPPPPPPVPATASSSRRSRAAGSPSPPVTTPQGQLSPRTLRHQPQTTKSKDDPPREDEYELSTERSSWPQQVADAKTRDEWAFDQDVETMWYWADDQDRSRVDDEPFLDILLVSSIHINLLSPETYLTPLMLFHRRGGLITLSWCLRVAFTSAAIRQSSSNLTFESHLERLWT